jgi:hypothetical protein
MVIIKEDLVFCIPYSVSLPNILNDVFTSAVEVLDHLHSAAATHALLLQAQVPVDYLHTQNCAKPKILKEHQMLSQLS